MTWENNTLTQLDFFTSLHKLTSSTIFLRLNSTPLLQPTITLTVQVTSPPKSSLQSGRELILKGNRTDLDHAKQCSWFKIWTRCAIFAGAVTKTWKTGNEHLVFCHARGYILVTARSHVLESHGKIFTTSADTWLNFSPIFVPVIDFAKKSLSNSPGNGILKEKNAQKLSRQVLNYKVYVLLII